MTTRPKLALMPFYVLHSSHQHSQLQSILKLLASDKFVGALDITLVRCAERDEIANMSTATRLCLNPQVVRGRDSRSMAAPWAAHGSWSCEPSPE